MCAGSHFHTHRLCNVFFGARNIQRIRQARVWEQLYARMDHCACVYYGLRTEIRERRLASPTECGGTVYRINLDTKRAILRSVCLMEGQLDLTHAVYGAAPHVSSEGFQSNGSNPDFAIRTRYGNESSRPGRHSGHDHKEPEEK